MNKIILIKKNLLHNLKVIKEKTPAKICAVVKANAYGHGLEEICKTLYGKVEFFAVANLKEALQIRAFDKQTKVLILGKCENYKKAEENNISVTVFSLEEIKKLSKQKFSNLNVHIKIDTGMNRLGFTSTKEFLLAFKELEKQKNVKIEGIFTHFSTLRNDIDFYRKQVNKLERYLMYVKNKKDIIIHGGGSFVVMFTNKFDMVRCGIFLYGYGFSRLKPVLSVTSQIVQKKHIIKGDYVGYSKTYTANEDMEIGVIPLGYSDGIPRSFIGQNFRCKNTKFEILNVCMDMTMIKLPTKTTFDTEITIFEDAHKWANVLNTNDHDVLVKFSNFRGQRILK